MTLEGAQKRFAKTTNRKIMKRNLLTLAAVGAIALGGFAIAQAEGGPGRWHGQGLSIEHLTKTLNLTSDQQAKVQPILDQAKPQIIAIHKDAMQKTHAVMASTMSQIRPLLTPEQQTKFDAVQKARQDMRAAQQELHNAMKE
jgi:periplasmic protein CpxP/Spy